jgi:phage gpG-like protein
MAKGIRDVDKGWKDFRKRMEGAKGKHVTKVGLPSGSTPAVVGKKGGNKPFLDLVQIAAVHEFGAPNRNIPERSFIRSTTDEEKKNLAHIANLQHQKFIAGKIDLKTALGIIGEYLTGKMKNKIRQRIPPPNSPQTIKRKTVQGKKGDVPLIDTGQLVQSITHVEHIQGAK